MRGYDDWKLDTPDNHLVEIAEECPGCGFPIYEQESHVFHTDCSFYHTECVSQENEEEELY